MACVQREEDANTGTLMGRPSGGKGNWNINCASVPHLMAMIANTPANTGSKRKWGGRRGRDAQHAETAPLCHSPISHSLPTASTVARYLVSDPLFFTLTCNQPRHMSIHTHTYTHTHTHVQTYTHTHARTQTHAHINEYTQQGDGMLIDQRKKLREGMHAPCLDAPTGPATPITREEIHLN